MHETVGIDCHLVRVGSSWRAEVSGPRRDGGSTVFAVAPENRSDPQALPTYSSEQMSDGYDMSAWKRMSSGVSHFDADSQFEPLISAGMT